MTRGTAFLLGLLRLLLTLAGVAAIVWLLILAMAAGAAQRPALAVAGLVLSSPAIVRPVDHDPAPFPGTRRIETRQEFLMRRLGLCHDLRTFLDRAIRLGGFPTSDVLLVVDHEAERLRRRLMTRADALGEAVVPPPGPESA